MNFGSVWFQGKNRFGLSLWKIEVQTRIWESASRFVFLPFLQFLFGSSNSGAKQLPACSPGACWIKLSCSKSKFHSSLFPSPLFFVFFLKTFIYIYPSQYYHKTQKGKTYAIKASTQPRIWFSILWKSTYFFTIADILAALESSIAS